MPIAPGNYPRARRDLKSRTVRDFVSGLTSLNAPNLTWDSIKRLRDTVKMKIVLKGILAHEDAKLAADYGIDGIIVSNHSGRVVDSGRATIEVLPEIIEAVGARMPVLVDPRRDGERARASLRGRGRRSCRQASIASA